MRSQCTATREKPQLVTTRGSPRATKNKEKPAEAGLIPSLGSATLGPVSTHLRLQRCARGGSRPQDLQHMDLVSYYSAADQCPGPLSGVHQQAPHPHTAPGGRDPTWNAGVGLSPHFFPPAPPTPGTPKDLLRTVPQERFWEAGSFSFPFRKAGAHRREQETSGQGGTATSPYARWTKQVGEGIPLKRQLEMGWGPPGAGPGVPEAPGATRKQHPRLSREEPASWGTRWAG